MKPKESDKLSEFERRLQAVLIAGTEGVDARVRSRLNQARQAAVGDAGRSRLLRPGLWLLPAGAAAAALLAVLIIGGPVPRHGVPFVRSEVPRPLAADDVDLLADTEGLDLVQSDFTDGSFYEWAASQGDGGEAPGSGV